MGHSVSNARKVVRRYRVSVEFHHVDMMNVVHNAQYFKWFERGRLGLMNEVVPIDVGKERQLAAVVVENHCEYLHTATFGDELVVTTRHRIVASWTGTLTFEHEIANARTKDMICEGYTKITIVDLKTGRLQKELPEDIWSRYQALSLPQRTD